MDGVFAWADACHKLVACCILLEHGSRIHTVVGAEMVAGR